MNASDILLRNVYANLAFSSIPNLATFASLANRLAPLLQLFLQKTKQHSNSFVFSQISVVPSIHDLMAIQYMSSPLRIKPQAILGYISYLTSYRTPSSLFSSAGYQWLKDNLATNSNSFTLTAEKNTLVNPLLILYSPLSKTAESSMTLHRH